MKHLYLIGGPMGVGKTAVCQALKMHLSRSVFLDGDWCWDMHPFSVTKETKAMVTENIVHLLSNFLLCSELDHVIFGWVMHEQGIIDSILSRLPLDGCQVHAISLVCSEAALRSRLEKDIAAGLRANDVIERSLARLPMYERLNTVSIDTSLMSVEEIAKVITQI